jgi:aminodeoxyfutalosine synthase
MLGIGTAQTALAYGADDIDGTVRHELIYHDAGATTPELLTVEQIRQLIIEAGREPVERDTTYHRVYRNPDHWLDWRTEIPSDPPSEPLVQPELLSVSREV